MSHPPGHASAEGALFTTAPGLLRFRERVDRARAAYDAVIASNGDAAEAGDNSVWHDNFAYEENQRQMHQLARRVCDLTDALRRLHVVEPSAAPTKVEIGSAVTIDDGTRTERFVVAGYEDGDTDLRRVAYTAPLATALMGAEVGDARTVRVGGRVRELEVVAIEAVPAEER